MWHDGRLLIRPASELAGLRQLKVVSRQLEPGSSGPLSLPVQTPLDQHGRIAGCQRFWQVGPSWEFLLTNSAAVPSFALILANDANEQTIMNYDAATGKIDLDRSGSSMADEVDKTARKLQLEQPLQKLQVYYDNSVLEIFANDQVCLTARVYPLASAYGRIIWTPQPDGRDISRDISRDIGRESGREIGRERDGESHGENGRPAVWQDGGSRTDASEMFVWNLGLSTGGGSDVQDD
jgi:hypothetical protein